ncbi:hypothetical protein A3737_36650, partial [Oleiphilus sp. HI0065]
MECAFPERLLVSGAEATKMSSFKRRIQDMQFDGFLNKVAREPSTVRLDGAWMQGRAGFGGLVAALVYESMRKQLSQPAPVRCLQISFVGPVDDSELELTSEILREGKNVSQVLGRGLQNGQTKVIVQGSFGAGRESAIDLAPERLSLNGSVNDTTKLPYIEGAIPEFTRNFDYRYLTPFPFMGSDKPYLEGYVRFAESPKVMTEAHLLGLVDAWPPTPLPMMKSLCMASSLSWTIEFIQPQPSLRPDEYTQYRAEIIESSGGYAYAKALISNEAGELLAIS